jgi:hypothetical protein
MTMKLYLVKLRGMRSEIPSDTKWGESYVVAPDPTEAYRRVREYLADKDIGFSAERELDSITLLAEDVTYPECRVKLYLPKEAYND